MKRNFTLVTLLIVMFAFVQQASALTYNVTVPAGTNACYITGEMNGWSPSATPMTKVDATHFTIDLPDATVSQKYQYLSGPDWKYIEKDADGNAITDRVWSESDVVVKWLETFSLDERDVTIDVLVPASVKELYLVGSFNGWSSPSAATKMTYVSQDPEGKVFTITVHSVDAINMEFKFCAGPSWSYQQTAPTANFVYGTTENSTAVVATGFQNYYDPALAGTINITATVPAGTAQVFIQGDFLGYDMANAIEGTKNTDGTFSFALPNVLVIEYRLYNKADWSYPEVDETGNERANRVSVYPTDANLAVTVIGWKQVINGVKQLNADNYKVYSLNKSVVVEGVNSQVELFDMSGRRIQTQKMAGTFTSKALNTGLYIIRVDGATQKVSVN